MFKDQTVFVIGAGASAEFDLPVGGQLTSIIKKNSKFRFHHRMTEGVREIMDAMETRYPDGSQVNPLLEAAAEINRAIDSAGSIDEFINRNADDPLIAEMGKLQIAFAIHEAEVNSLLSPSKLQNDVGWSGLEKTWITTFARILFEGVRRSDIDKIGNNITIVCFNYDRCIEIYLINAIKRSFKNVTIDQASEIVGRMNIIHPYGMLGPLPQQKVINGTYSVSFGENILRDSLYKMTSTLVTWSESTRDLELVRKIKHAISDAKIVVFLGFAFAPQNMQLLTMDAGFSKNSFTKVYSTGFGLYPQTDATLKENIGRLWGQMPGSSQSNFINIEYDTKCRRLLDIHSLNIASSIN